jgi:hypothetical protein
MVFSPLVSAFAAFFFPAGYQPGREDAVLNELEYSMRAAKSKEKRKKYRCIFEIIDDDYNALIAGVTERLRIFPGSLREW